MAVSEELGAQSNSTDIPIQDSDGQRKRIRLTAEEHRALKECNRESFYYRCLPISTLAMISTHLAVKSGYLRPNPKWGSSVKMLGAGLVGYIMGKFSYKKKCAEKLMSLPNSTLGEALRRRYQMGDTSFEIDVHDDLPDSLVYGDGARSKMGNQGISELDMDQNTQAQGLDDSFRPTLDDPPDLPAEAIPPPKTHVTYDELRKKNREEYDSRRQDMVRKMDPLTKPDSTLLPSLPPEDYSRHRKSTNKYGDSWDD